MIALAQRSKSGTVLVTAAHCFVDSANQPAARAKDVTVLIARAP